MLAGNFCSDHFPVALDVALTAEAVTAAKPNLDFFRVNMDVAASTVGMAGVRNILAHWIAEPGIAPLAKLEAAFREIKAFLRDLGQDLANERRQKEKHLRAELQSLLLAVHGCPEDLLPDLLKEQADVQAKLKDIEDQAARGHQIRAQIKWAQDGDRPSSESCLSMAFMMRNEFSDPPQQHCSVLSWRPSVRSSAPQAPSRTGVANGPGC